MKTGAYILSLAMPVLLLIPPARAGVPENIKIGLYGRTEQNIYRYYNGLSEGNFYTQRVSNGYSAGLMLHSSINYLFNAGMSLGMSESSYSPNIRIGNNTLWKVQLRSWQYDIWGELKLGKNEKKGLRFLAGLEWLITDYKREIWATENKSKDGWQSTRVFPRIGLSYEYPLKKRLTLMPNAGFRLAPGNGSGFDYIFSQFWAGISMGCRFYGS